MAAQQTKKAEKESKVKAKKKDESIEQTQTCKLGKEDHDLARDMRLDKYKNASSKVMLIAMRSFS